MYISLICSIIYVMYISLTYYIIYVMYMLYEYIMYYLLKDFAQSICSWKQCDIQMQ